MEDNLSTCPNCGSDNVAEILWGLPSFTEELQKELAEGKVVLGGCCVSSDDPKFECNNCGQRFGKSGFAEDFVEIMEKRKLKGIIYGAAVGDALGVPYEFQGRDSFTCKGMASGGAHQMPKGTFSDDTSMLLATQDSIRERGCIDVEDMRERYRKWLYEGAYTADGEAFDVGNATATALSEGYGLTHERSNGNGSLMRIAPLACTGATDDEIRAVSAITHAHPISMEACVAFVHILRAVMAGEDLESAIEANMPDNPRFAFIREVKDWSRDCVKSTGYVIDTRARRCGAPSTPIRTPTASLRQSISETMRIPPPASPVYLPEPCTDTVRSTRAGSGSSGERKSSTDAFSAKEHQFNSTVTICHS